MIQRRRFLRYDREYKVTYSTSDNPEAIVNTKSFNVSLGGIGIKVHDFIVGNKEIQLKIYGPHSKTPVAAKGKIVWQGYLSDYGEKRAGIQFTEVHLEDLQGLLSS